jgi:hypothetical protein
MRKRNNQLMYVFYPLEMTFGGFTPEFTEDLKVGIDLPEHVTLVQGALETDEEFDKRADKDWEEYCALVTKLREEHIQKESQQQYTDDLKLIKRTKRR